MHQHVSTEGWLNFTWDPKKERFNLAKHGCDFKAAVTVRGWPGV